MAASDLKADLSQPDLKPCSEYITRKKRIVARVYPFKISSLSYLGPQYLTCWLVPNDMRNWRPFIVQK